MDCCMSREKPAVSRLIHGAVIAAVIVVHCPAAGFAQSDSWTPWSAQDAKKGAAPKKGDSAKDATKKAPPAKPPDRLDARHRGQWQGHQDGRQRRPVQEAGLRAWFHPVARDHLDQKPGAGLLQTGPRGDPHGHRRQRGGHASSAAATCPTAK
jgi:hypothetical protein